MTSLDTPTRTAPDADVDTRDMIIKCAKLTKMFRDFWMRNRVKAVNAIDIEVLRGEVFGLLGPNGSGKSTTIKMILGLLHPTSGHIAIFGRHPRDVAIKKQIGYLPEESYLYRFLNARETLDYYGRLFHQNRSQRKRRIETLLEMVGLDKVANRPVGEYSKGMQRRIGLAQALINDPQLLILDEPTTGLDPIGTRQIKDLILELKRRGKTILLCSHLLADVEDVCDRVSIMFGGKVRREGTVDELLVQESLTNLQTTQLDAEDVQAIEQLLEKRGKHIERVEQPRQKLEALFLNIVHEAQAEGVDTSGATGGGPLAEFLRGDEQEVQEDVGEALIDRLVETKPADAGKTSGPADATKTPPAEAAEPIERDSLIDELVSPGDKPEQAKPRDDRSSSEPSPVPEPQPEEDVDDSVLDSLLGDEKKKDK
ncbi:ABC transporter ATP-binding protein [Phycisphaerales bacterium AB-hyl4]|uniref:ABC transporter ATP-binding protein n=1 Tax=Natronomicrosphaera hydrolytica TaxID=3242702 RepID=A0ABV4U7B5_9BACT